MQLLDPTLHAAQITAQLKQPQNYLVACLCAAWCDVCRDIQPLFEQLAKRYSQCCFVWIDIETYATSMDHYTIENFPTLCIEDAQGLLFFGSIVPKITVIESMLEHLKSLAPQSSQHPSLREALVQGLRD